MSDIHSLPSYYLLLLTDDERGHAMSWLPIGLAGALLCQLAIAGNVQIVDGRVTPGDTRPDSAPAAAVWEALRAEPKLRKPMWWVGRLAGKTGLRARDLVADALVHAGVLQRVEKSFGRVHRPTQDGSVEAAVRAEIERALDMQDPDLDVSLMTLVALTVDTGWRRTLSTEKANQKAWASRVKAWRKAQTLPVDVAMFLDATRQSVAAASSG